MRMLPPPAPASGSGVQLGVRLGFLRMMSAGDLLGGAYVSVPPTIRLKNNFSHWEKVVTIFNVTPLRVGRTGESHS